MVPVSLQSRRKGSFAAVRKERFLGEDTAGAATQPRWRVVGVLGDAREFDRHQTARHDGGVDENFAVRGRKWYIHIDRPERSF